MAEAPTAADTYIVFTVAGTSYGIRSDQVRHIEMVETITRVPNAAAFVDGVVFSRGQVVPAVSLRARFGFERAPYDLRTRLIVVQHDGRSVGLVVDDGREFIRLSPDAIQAPQDTLAGLSSQYIHGIASVNDRLILLLTLEALLNFAEPLIAA
jgi:purine-binding chemotaxis protein CheW